MKNFEFLKDLYPELCDIASFAEKYVYSDPNGALFKIRILAEKLNEENVTLVYGARDEKYNHAVILKGWLEEKIALM